MTKPKFSKHIQDTGRPKQKSYVEYVRESKLREILKRCNN